MIMKIVLAQMAVKNNMDANYKKAAACIEEAFGSEILVFPLLQMSPYFPQIEKINADAAVNRLSDSRIHGLAYLAKKRNLQMILNTYLEHEGRRSCASLWYDKQGSLKGISTLAHPLNMPSSYEANYFAPGCEETLVFDIPHGKAAVVTGADMHYPEAFRSAVLRGAKVIFVPWHGIYEDRGMFVSEIHTAAYQNGVFIAVCARAGRQGKLVFQGGSMLVGPDGRVIMEADDQEQLIRLDIDLHEVEKERNRHPYLKYLYGGKQDEHQ